MRGPQSRSWAGDWTESDTADERPCAPAAACRSSTRRGAPDAITNVVLRAVSRAPFRPPYPCAYASPTAAGAIRVAANESYFEVTQRATPGFIKALRRATIAPEDEGLVIEQAQPRDVAPAQGRGKPPRASLQPREKWKGRKAGNRR